MNELKNLVRDIKPILVNYRAGKYKKWQATALIATRLDLYREDLQPYIDGRIQTMPPELIQLYTLLHIAEMTFKITDELIKVQQQYSLNRLKEKGYDTKVLQDAIDKHTKHCEDKNKRS